MTTPRNKNVREIKKAHRRERAKTISYIVAFEMIIFCIGIVFGCFICTAYAFVGAPQTAQTAEVIPEAETVVTERSDARYDITVQYGDTVLDQNLLHTMIKMCDQYDVPLALALAVAEQESGFNPDAVSTTNDHGLMQINEINFSWLRNQGIEPLDHEGNIEAGVLMLSKVIKSHGDYHRALMAYNCGDAGAKRLWDNGVYSSNYSRSIIERFDRWSEIVGGK